MPPVRIKRKSGAAGEKPPKKETIVQKQVQLELRLLVSNGNKYRDESFESFVETLRDLVKERWPEANFTQTGGYYLVDGKVCRPEDFDRDTMDRKPGTFPPSWSVQGDEKKDAILAERNEEQKKNPNKMSHQPENLLTSKEVDMVKASASAPKKRPVSLKKKEAPVETPKRRLKLKAR